MSRVSFETNRIDRHILTTLKRSHAIQPTAFLICVQYVQVGGGSTKTPIVISGVFWNKWYPQSYVVLRSCK